MRAKGAATRCGDVGTRPLQCKPFSVLLREAVASTDPPVVGVLMGSSSDWETLQHAAAILAEFGVPHECRVVSAHRMPDDMFAYAQERRRPRPEGADRRRRRRRAPAGHAGGQDRGAGARRAGGQPPPARRRFAALDRADAQGRAGGHLRHRRGRCRQRGAVRGGDARQPGRGVAQPAGALPRRPDRRRAGDDAGPASERGIA